MSTETEGVDARHEHFRAVTVTALAALMGVVAAVGSSVVTADAATAAEAARNQRALLVVLVAIAVQPGLLRLAGLLKDDFGAKDMLFIAFMTFSLWFVTWGIILSSDLTIAA